MSAIQTVRQHLELTFQPTAFVIGQKVPLPNLVVYAQRKDEVAAIRKLLAGKEFGVPIEVVPMGRIRLGSD
jgi:hypothetical protein